MYEVKPDQHSRCSTEADRPCKVYDPRIGKYLTGTATVMSDASMLVNVNRPLELHSGDLLLVGLAQKRRQLLIHSTDMVRVRVIRSVRTTDGRTAIMVELCDPTISNVSRLRKAA